MSMPEIQLRAAGAAIDRMPDAELRGAFRQLNERRNARTPMEVLRQQDELGSLGLHQAAYQLAGEAADRGELTRAAHWYTAAALNDYGDAALKLAIVLDALAKAHLDARGSAPATREELDLLSEACRWYSDALAAGEVEADELLEELIDRHLGKSRPARQPAGPARPGPRPAPAAPARAAATQHSGHAAPGAPLRTHILSNQGILSNEGKL